MRVGLSVSDTSPDLGQLTPTVSPLPAPAGFFYPPAVGLRSLSFFKTVASSVPRKSELS